VVAPPDVEERAEVSDIPENGFIAPNFFLQWQEEVIGTARWPGFREMSQEEQDRRTAESKEHYEKELAMVTALHNRVLGGLPEALLPFAELHKPNVYEYSYPDYEYSYPDCLGCDPGSYAEESPGWPCTTYELLMEKAGVSK
jgi:hypothetical protein